MNTEHTSHNIYWDDSQGEPCAPFARLEGPLQADVVIVGGGFTGLWSAYYLKHEAPQLEVVVLEAERFGHGASGRNGGWVVGNLAGLERHLHGLDRQQRQACCRLLANNVDHLGATLATEGIDADFHKGGALYAAARYPAQESIQRHYREHLLEIGHAEQDCVWLNADELSAMARMRNPYGGIWHRQVATIHPRKLVNGLVQRLDAMGVRLYEHSRVCAMSERRVSTHEGSVSAQTIVQATEGYSEHLGHVRQHVIPVQSLIIATEPLSESTWQEVGLHDRPTFADASRLINYGQRTRDGRLVFGARGAYRLGAHPRHDTGISASDMAMRRDLLVDMFPALEGVNITHGWGGSLGLSRSFRPHVVLDRKQGLANAGGYAGEGVAATHLMGRTLADMILQRDTELTRMPWVFDNHSLTQVVKRWEPEPVRWLAAQTILFSYAGEEALMRRQRHIPVLSNGLTRLNDAFASVIE
ncbi:NAD(P)/FAD-dependent oxidoreductase [Halomonas binhaiensis]|uniref:FAD-dependent oxidoreductase n=1 Tax=Halomonas binhaiensis TaxID=2562282 RepID=A0A5C1NFK8_9GAMM|nr:FAD-dependent oxidoreductase [Halomonas binhaiensis]QEM81198.1 FAD-dependent oxidoreductase [Halomonas binhaiensis]